MEEDKNKNQGTDDLENTEDFDTELDDEDFESELDELLGDDHDEDEDDDEDKDDLTTKKRSGKDNKDYVIQRLRKQVEKLRASKADPKSDKRIDDIAESLEKSKRELDISNLVATSERYKPIEKVLRKYAAHPSYKGVPLKIIARALVDEYEEKRVSKSQAVERANESKDRGTTTRGTVRPQGQVDYSKMSRKEILELHKKAGRNQS